MASARVRVQLLGRAGAAFSTAGPSPISNVKRGPIGYRPGDLVPSMAALIPELPQCKTMAASKLPWVQSAETFFETWRKVVPCMSKYEAFLKAHKVPTQPLGQGLLRDRRAMSHLQQGKVMTDEVSVAIGEFYLCVAYQLRREEIDAAGSDPTALMQVARRCADEDFEPFIENARALVADYDASLHQALEETSPFYEVDEGLFWRANFDVAAPAEFLHFLTATGQGSGQVWVNDIAAYNAPCDVAAIVAETRERLFSNEPALEPARRAAQIVYSKFLEASAMPVKADIASALMENGFLVSRDIFKSNTLLPEKS